MTAYPTPRFLLALLVSLSWLRAAQAEEVILQYFNTSWAEIEGRIPEVAEAGYTSLWLPPPFKGASGTFSVGFDTFDRFDLGDKDQQGTVRTKYGTKADLLSLMKIAHRFGLKIYFDNVMAHNGGVLADDTMPGELFPDLPGFVPEDFHLIRRDGKWVKATDSIDYQDEWQVINRNPFGWDIAQENPNTSFDSDGTNEGDDFPKWSGVRHPGQTHLYLDDDLPVGMTFSNDPVYTFADKEPFTDTGYGAGSTGAGNGVFDWNDVDADGQHDLGEDSESFDDVGIDSSNPDRRTATWGFGDGVYNMGDPVAEDVNQMLFRQLRWFVDVAKPDGFRLDAVKHVPSYFFGQQGGADADSSGSGYNGQVQEQFNITRGHSDWGNHRNTVFENTLARDDALLFGEHLGSPPDENGYLESGMRVANDNFLNAVGGFGGIGNSLAGFDQPGFGSGSTVARMSYPMSHDNNFIDGSVRPATFQFMLTREGLPIVYTDGYNVQGAPDYFPKPSYVPFLGQYGEQWVTGALKVRRDFVRGQQIPKWNDQGFAAWEMRDKRENPGMDDPAGTVMLVMMARPFTEGQARDVVSTFPADAHLRNYSPYGGGFQVRVGNDGKLRDGGGNFPVVPSGGFFAFSWDNPRLPAVWDGQDVVRSIEIFQGSERAPMMEHEREDGRDGDPAYDYTAMIPRVTDASALRFLARADGSAANILMKLDGGIDLNGNGRDTPPPVDRFFENDAQDLFTGYEQMQFVDRTVEKFAATNVDRNVIGSAGAETWEVAIGSGAFTRNDGGGVVTDTGTVDWAYHNPEDTVDGGMAQFLLTPNNFIELTVKVGYTADPDRAWVYYTTDGASFPEGSYGVGKGETQVVELFFGMDGIPDGGGTPAWWTGTLPSMPAGTVLRYKIGVHKDDAPDRFPFSQRDVDLKRKMETQFEIIGFDPASVAHFPHNDHGEQVVGLEDGFHVLRTKAFLNRSGSASIFRTQTQTFYLDLARPTGELLFPREGDTVGGSSYGAVAVSDESVTEVWYNLLDSDAGNDSATNGNGAGNWAQASAVRVPSQIAGTGYVKEWRFDYQDIPSSGSATLRVRFKEASSSDDNSLSDAVGHFTTVERALDTGFPVNYRIAFPAMDGETVDGNYVMKLLFDKSLGFEVPDATLLSEFTVSIGGIELAEGVLSIIRGETPSDDALAIALPNVYNGNPDFLHQVRVVHERGDVTLTDTRLVKAAVAELPDSDGDGLPDAWEQLFGLDAGNPAGIHGADGDFDGDGSTNLFEYLAGSNPISTDLVGQPLPDLSLKPNGTSSLVFRALPSRIYRIQFSDDLDNWAYASNGLMVAEEHLAFEWIDDGSTTGELPADGVRRFYRVEVSLR